jgi:hypothetical protein
MRNLALASLLALSLGISGASQAFAFGTKPLFKKFDSADGGDYITELAPLLDSMLSVQVDDSVASKSTESVFAESAISVAPQAAGVLNLSEGFNSVSSLSASGWAFVNNSSPAPLSTADWTQGITATSNYAAQSGPTDSFAQVDFASTSADTGGMVSNWLITPELDFSVGGVFSFYARSFGGNSRSELIQVLQSVAGSSINVGTTATDVGDFTKLLGSAGSSTGVTTDPGSLPTNSWGFYKFNIAPSAGSGRLAFRYFATNGGVNGAQAQYATIDTVNYLATGAPEPTVSSLAGFATLGLASYFKSKRKRTVH